MPVSKPSKLAEFWQFQEAMRLKAMPPALTPKQAGQLRFLYRLVGPFAKRVVGYGFSSWPKFATQAKLAAGLSTVPNYPHIGFLIKHIDVAVSMMIEDKKISSEELGHAMKVLHGDDY
ncbi:MAG: hypothetical protein ACLGSH_11135 [Acidobacteriota bacterium]